MPQPAETESQSLFLQQVFHCHVYTVLNSVVCLMMHHVGLQSYCHCRESNTLPM